MLLELASTAVLASITGATVYHQSGASNDHKKIEQICQQAGLYKTDKDGKKRSVRIYRRNKIEGGMEYVYQIPLGMSFKDFSDKHNSFQDGLNIKKSVPDISLGDLKQLTIDKTILKQIKKVIDKKKKLNKEVVMTFDGMLKVKVYDTPLTSRFDLTDEVLSKCKGWEIPLGMTRENFLKWDTELGHLIVAGVTTYGKTVFLKMYITSIIDKKPKDAKFSLIDLKGGLAFARFENCSQVSNFATDAKESEEVLKAVVDEMKAKQKRYRSKGYENIVEAGEKERHFIVIDEAAELSPSGHTGEEKKTRIKCEEHLSEIARLGQQLGYRLIYATQYPVKEVLNQSVKQNAPTRIVFQVGDQTASRVALGDVDEGIKTPNQLPFIKGRAITRVAGQLHEVQCCYVDNGYIKEKITPHIVVKARKENENVVETRHTEATTDRRNIRIIEEA